MNLVDVGLGDIGFGELALGVVAGGTVLALQDLLAVLVELELRDHDLRRVNADWHGLAVRLLLHDARDVDHELLTVHSGDATFTVLVRATHNGHFVVLADRDGADLHQAQDRAVR